MIKNVMLILLVASAVINTVVLLRETREGQSAWDGMPVWAFLIGMPLYIVVMSLAFVICKGIEKATGKDLGI